MVRAMVSVEIREMMSCITPPPKKKHILANMVHRSSILTQVKHAGTRVREATRATNVGHAVVEVGHDCRDLLAELEDVGGLVLLSGLGRGRRR